MYRDLWVAGISFAEWGPEGLLNLWFRELLPGLLVTNVRSLWQLGRSFQEYVLNPKPEAMW